jgi:hypothetical protein
MQIVVVGGTSVVAVTVVVEPAGDVVVVDWHWSMARPSCCPAGHGAHWVPSNASRSWVEPV